MNNNNSPLTELRQIRIDKLAKIRELGIDPYPAKPARTDKITDAKQRMDEEVCIGGRIMAIRGHGNLFFIDVMDPEDSMQVMVRKGQVSDSELELARLLDIGDFISARGKVFNTKSGEVTVEANMVQILSKSLRPLPDTWSGLKDEETRYRQRYLDFILNPEVKEKIMTRTRVISEIRSFLVNEGFIEVETPILETNASGALASPFTTHINAYDMDLYLRICMGELWQKKLMIAGFEKTFEIGRAFRNEGVDREHNPEFTMLEYYYGYANYEMNMEMQERLMANVVKAATGSYEVEIEGNKINFEGPYPRKSMRDLILEATKIDINEHQGREGLSKVMADYGFKIDPNWGYGHLVDEFYKEYVRPNLIQPVFVTHHPEDLKPLAKKDPETPGYTQSFQLLANGFELTNNYSELNDPIDQAERFNVQSDLAESGDDETMSSDMEFVEALEYGMPPTSGTGIGIDRLVALLTNSHHIREVITFPLMKPKGGAKQQASANSEELVSDSVENCSDENGKRFVVVVNKEIEVGRLMNAIGHITAGFVATYPNMKEFEFLNYVNSEDKTQAILSHFPFIILKADKSADIRKLKANLDKQEMSNFSFSESMTVGTSEGQMKATKETKIEDLNYFGLITFGETEELKALTKNFSLFK